MRRILRCLLSLLLVSASYWAYAQTPSFGKRILTEARSYATESTTRLATPTTGRIAVPAHDFTSHQNCDAQVRMGSALSGGTVSAQAAVTCGPDTVLYPLAKTTGLRVLTFADSIAFGQYYDAPQPITVSGMSFYAWVDSATNQTVTLTARLFNAGLDSLPTGAPLATATITIDSNFFGGTLALLEKSVSWTPVTVNAPYVVTIENISPIAVGTVVNDYGANPRDGLEEWLGMIFLPGGPTAWYHGYEINIGPDPFDADALLYPHVTYDVTATYAPNPNSGCTNQNTAWLNQSSPVLSNRMYNQAAFIGQPETSFDWDYGDGSPVANVVNGSHTYTANGSFTVTLLDSLFGWRISCADQTTGTVTVAPGTPITAAFTYTTAGLNANFTDASGPAPIGWLWDFGDGNTSMVQNPTHTYTASGVYTVCLIAANLCGADTICQSVVVGSLPAASCDTFTNITGTAALYLAPNGGYVAGHNGFLDSTKAEKFTLTAPFAFEEALFLFGHKESPTPNTSKVIATVWDATGPGGSPGAVLSTQDVFYNQIDTTGNFTAVSFPGVVGTNGNFFVGIQLIYAPGDTVGLITNTIGQTIPATAWELFQGGTTWVPFDDSTSWGIGVSLGVWVIQTVEADFSSTTATLTANFTDQSLGANGWVWDFGDGNTSTTQNPTHTYANPGTYNVCLIALNGTCADTICQPVTVTGGGCPNPTAAFSFTVTNLTATFTDLSTTSTTITNWLWDFGDGNFSPAQSPVHAYAAPGTYTVCLTVTDSCGTDSTCQAVTITCPTLVAAFQDTVIGLQLGVLDMSTGTPTSWTYSWGDGTPNTTGQPNTFHTYAMAGVYTVCLTVSDGCSSDSTCTTIVVGCPIPIAAYSFTTAGLVVNFTDQSTNLPTTWAWDFGDGNTSTLQNPTHTYASADTFLVCLIASSTCGADTICDTIISGCNTPVAAWTSTSTALSVAFTDASTNTPTSWLWDFGDGNTSTVQSPTHTYATPGTYTVCLTATSFCGSDSMCSTVTVTCPAPQAGFTNTVSALSATFVDQSTGSPTTWLWTFGDGNTSTLQNPTHTYAQGGSYQVCLTATNACGSTQTCTVVTLSCPTPIGNFSFNSVNLTFNFQDLTTGGATSWFWDFGDGNSATAQNPSHTYANSGTFLVCLTAVNSCGADTFCQPVTVNCPQPVSDFSLLANNLTVNFTDISAGNPTGWQWDFGDGSPTSIQTNPMHTYANPGTYLVCLTAVNTCGANTYCDSITVTCPAPAANFSFITLHPTVNFTESSTGGATSWMWDFGDGNTSTLQNPSHTYSAVGTYTACLISSSVCGADTFCQSVIISCVPPSSDFSFAVSSDSIANFTNMASANSTAWTWDFGDGNTSTAANPTHTYAAPGTYTACLVVTNSCGQDTFCNNVVITCVNPTAGYTVQVNNSVANFANISLLGQSYVWDFGDGTTDTTMNPTHTYSQSGIFTVCLTVVNFCGSNTSCQNVVIACNAPVAAYSFQNGTDSVDFTDLSQNNPSSWLWDFGDGGTDTLQNPTHAFLFAGQFYVCLTATNACGTTTFCSWITVTAVGTDDADLINSSLTVYPNPGDGLFNIEAELPNALDLKFRVTNALGQEVLIQDAGKVLGVFRDEIDLRRFADGTYILEITAGENKIYRNLVKH